MKVFKLDHVVGVSGFDQFRPVLNRYTVININDCINNLPDWYENCNTNQVLIPGGHHKLKESSYTQHITWVNTILNRTDAWVIIPSYQGP